ncbi:zf-PARP-domain-containing protein [Xylaria digitata]|nr:zf-PARP-domain-containing protein [Xylaria digitata]
MSYRIEISPNNRAGCQDKVCKDAKTKITKGELRFGVWFVMPNTEHGSWKWRHWGCVSGKTISNVQESIKKDDDYDWDMLDGYDEIEDLEIKEKIQRVVSQGHIDAEDFNGDPEFNVPGKTAIRGRAKKPKADEEEADEDEPAPKKAAPKKAAGAKRGRKKAETEEDGEETEEEPEPVKKKAKVGRKSKKAEDDEEEEEVQPVKKARGGRKGKKNDEVDEENEEVKPPAKKAKGGRKAKQLDEDVNEDVEEPEEPAPAKKARSRKATAKKAPSPPPTDEEDEDEEPIVKTVAKGKAGRKSKAAVAAPKGGRRRISKGKAGDEE